LRQRNIGWRLDYVLSSEPLFGRVRQCEIQKEVGTSDHAPVVAEFEL
jgi:exodeoxyribonuclease-3